MEFFDSNVWDQSRHGPQSEDPLFDHLGPGEQRSRSHKAESEPRGAGPTRDPIGETLLNDRNGQLNTQLNTQLDPQLDGRLDGNGHLDGHLDGHRNLDGHLSLTEPMDGLNDGLHLGDHLSDHLGDSLDESLNASMNGSVAGSLSSSHGLHDAMRHSIDRSMSEALDPLDVHNQYFSPALSFQGTPLLSPSAAPMHSIAYRPTPQGTPHHTPYGTPQLTAQNHAQGQAQGQVQATSPTGPNEFGMYYAQRGSRAGQGPGSGKIGKQSPTTRWRSGSLPEDEFRLGDPALEMADHGGPAGADLDERLRSAIQATAKANSRANSVASIKSATSIKSAPSRRASAGGGGSTRTTPRIRPKVAGSAELSPHVPTFDGEPMNEEVFLKSNYQNLLDGTHQHLELAAADRMVADLRSKKAVHKLAEQERRNRMNTAIGELAALLGPGDEKLPPSKAATVERATQHIKQLQQRIRELEATRSSVSATPSASPPAKQA